MYSDNQGEGKYTFRNSVVFSGAPGILGSWDPERGVRGGGAMTMAATTPPRGINQVNSARIQTHLASEITFIKYTNPQRVKLKTLGESLCFLKFPLFRKFTE